MLEGRGYGVQFVQVNLLVQGHSEHLGPRGTKLLGPLFGLGRITCGQPIREKKHHTTATLSPETEKHVKMHPVANSLHFPLNYSVSWNICLKLTS